MTHLATTLDDGALQYRCKALVCHATNQNPIFDLEEVVFEVKPEQLKGQAIVQFVATGIW